MKYVTINISKQPNKLLFSNKKKKKRKGRGHFTCSFWLINCYSSMSAVGDVCHSETMKFRDDSAKIIFVSVLHQSSKNQLMQEYKL